MDGVLLKGRARGIGMAAYRGFSSPPLKEELRSAPAQKSRPWPVKTMHFTRGSAERVVIVSSSSVLVSMLVSGLPISGGLMSAGL